MLMIYFRYSAEIARVLETEHTFCECSSLASMWLRLKSYWSNFYAAIYGLRAENPLSVMLLKLEEGQVIFLFPLQKLLWNQFHKAAWKSRCFTEISQKQISLIQLAPDICKFVYEMAYRKKLKVMRRWVKRFSPAQNEKQPNLAALMFNIGKITVWLANDQSHIWIPMSSRERGTIPPMHRRHRLKIGNEDRLNIEQKNRIYDYAFSIFQKQKNVSFGRHREYGAWFSRIMASLIVAFHYPNPVNCKIKLMEDQNNEI